MKLMLTNKWIVLQIKHSSCRPFYHLFITPYTHLMLLNKCSLEIVQGILDISAGNMT